MKYLKRFSTKNCVQDLTALRTPRHTHITFNKIGDVSTKITKASPGQNPQEHYD